MLPPLDRGSIQTIASTGQTFEVVLQCIGVRYNVPTRGVQMLQTSLFAGTMRLPLQLRKGMKGGQGMSINKQQGCQGCC